MEISRDRLYTFDEVLEILHVSKATLLKLLGSGELQGAKIAGQWRVSGGDILAYYERMKRERG